MRFVSRIAIVVFAAAVPAFPQASLPAGSASFIIAQGQHNVGKTSYTITPNGARYSILSHGNLKISQLDYAFSNSETLTQRLNIASEKLSGKVNGSAATFAVTPDPGNSLFKLDISANGQAASNTVQRNAFTVFFPDFDASSYVVLLQLAAQNPNAPFWALIPKQNGLLAPATFAPDPDVNGTLNNAPVTVKHHELTIGSVSSDVYSTPDNQLLEVDIAGDGFSIVRDGFTLQAPQKAPAPPPAAPADPQADPQTQPQ
jgi:hypothetical protein